MSGRSTSAAVWQRARPAFLSKVVGPHFERLCREWARWYADPGTLGGSPTDVAAGTVSDHAARTLHEVDVAVLGREADRRTLLAIGEVKWGEEMGTGHLRRLARLRDLLRDRGVPGAGHARLLLFSGTGFTGALRQRAARDASVQLVDLARLYHGG